MTGKSKESEDSKGGFHSRVVQLLQAVRAMREGDFSRMAAQEGAEDALAELSRELKHLGETLQSRTGEIQTLLKITERINSGFFLKDTLSYVYDEFKKVIPYDRIGVSFIEEDGEQVRCYWGRAEAIKTLYLKEGYTAPIAGSSLERIILSGRPRILNDLEQYAREHPDSESTQLILKEGVRSSLTCPLMAAGKPIGFIFFSSCQPCAYSNQHIEIFQQLAGQVALITEKSRMYQQVLELNETKNRFLGIAAHDLRTPLTVIKGNLDLLRERILGDTTAAQDQALRQMNLSCQSMLTLINDFLSVSVIEAGKLELRLQDTDPAVFVADLCDFNRFLAQTKNISLHLDMDNQLPHFQIDPERLAQAVNNLISNAVKFSPPGGTIVLSVKLSGEKIQISVTDQGPGIPASETSRLFHFFEKTSVRPRHGESSTGLGLAIVRKLVEAHGGEVSVVSQEGKGATFSILLPAARG
ncbi:MAG TPA: GAF domain-containing sensor histidine kinase, partial [Candidatus Omnitrophota bacterium]|nr:GAF domain-containing sensor histidine kinase [Candidatus Omnitrophota bacterium]